MTQLPLDQAIPRFKANEERVDVFANGNSTQSYIASDGSTLVPSIQKFLADKDGQINTGAGSILAQATTQADNAADAASSSAASASSSASSASSAATSATSAQDAALSVVSYIQSPLKASFYCSGDGTNEDTKLSNFLADLVSRKVDGVFDIPVRFATTKTMLPYMATLRSSGEGRLINSGGTDGLIIDNSSVSTGFLHSLGWDGLGIYTETDGLGVALQFKGSSVIGDNLVRSVEMECPVFAGVDPSKGWSKGAVFDRVLQSRINGANVRGRTSLAAGCMVSAMEFMNGCNMVEVSGLDADWGENGILVKNVGTFSEGIKMLGGFVRAMKSGFLTQALGQYHTAKACHFDTTRIGVQFGVDGIISSDLSSIEDCLFLRSDAEPWSDSMGSPIGYVAATLDSNFGVVRGNRIDLDATESDSYGNNRQTAAYGIIIGSLVDTSKAGYSAVSSNVIIGPTFPIHLRTHTFACNVAGNVIEAFGNAGMVSTGILNDGGAGNLTTGNVVRNSTGVISFT